MVMPAGTARVAPVRLVPAMVTGTLAPWAPEAGVMLVNAGAAAVTVKVTGPLAPPAVVTVMVCAPVVAVAAMARVAVTWVAVTTGVPVAVMPAGRLRVAPGGLVTGMRS